MIVELVHALAPPTVGLFFTALSFLDERLILARIEPYLQEVASGDPEKAKHLVQGAVALSTFLANALVFIANCLIALLIYPIQSVGWKIGLLLLDLVLITLVVYEVIWLFTKNVVDIAEHTLFGGRTRIDQWLRREQIAFNIFALILFALGFYVLA